MNEPVLHALVAEFIEAGQVLRAAQSAYAEGYRRIEAYTPYAVDGLAEALGVRRTGVPALTLIGGITGATVAYGMEYYSAAIAYPLNVGGRGFHSWPAFIPITFELTVLFAALSAAIGMLALNRLPQPHHPIFNTPFFEERNASRFYLSVESSDARFHKEKTREFLQRQDPAALWEVWS